MEAIRKGLHNTEFFANYWLGIQLNPFQQRASLALDEALERHDFSQLVEMLMNAGNRTGKTVLLAIFHIKFAYYKIGLKYGEGYNEFKYRTFDLSPMSRQAKECLKYIEDILTGKLSWEFKGVRYSNATSLKLRNFFDSKNENLGELRYANRSMTYAFSTGEDMGAGFQGLSAGFISYDECVLSHHLEDELDSNVYPRLGDYGKLMLLVSTPNEEGKSQQYFHHLKRSAEIKENNYIVVGGSYLENIFISDEKRESFAATVRERDPVMAMQILYGDFVSTGGTMFEAATIERLWNGQKNFEEPLQNHLYFISADFGVADKGDETVFLVWDWTDIPVRIAYAYSRQGGDPYELMAVLRSIKMNYNDAEIIMDTTGLGGAIFKKLLKDLKPEAFEAAGTGNAKPNALFYAQVFMTKNRSRTLVDNRYVEKNPDFGWLRSPYLPKLANQLATYRIDDKKLKQDWVSAFYIGCYKIWKRYGDKEDHPKSHKLSRFRNTVPV